MIFFLKIEKKVKIERKEERKGRLGGVKKGQGEKGERGRERDVG